MLYVVIILAIWCITVLSVCLGIYIGSLQTNTPLNIKVPHIFKKKNHLGAIPKVTPREIDMKGTKREATEQAMTETLDKIL